MNVGIERLDGFRFSTILEESHPETNSGHDAYGQRCRGQPRNFWDLPV